MTPQAVQTREETILHHRERLNSVLLYIQENLYAPLTVEALAAVAGFSPFHFHRIFAAYLREPVSDHVRRIWPGVQETLPSQPSHFPLAAASHPVCK